MFVMVIELLGACTSSFQAGWLGRLSVTCWERTLFLMKQLVWRFRIFLMRLVLDCISCWSLCLNDLQDPVQEWGEEEEDGAVFGITLRREPVLPASDTAELSTAFIQYHTVKVRRLKAATLERLVTHLLDPEQQEPDFAHVFLATYRTFTTTSTLIELLFQR